MTTPNPAFEALLTHLKEARGFDFTGYKRSSLMRRVDRRMAQVSVSDYLEYLDYLQVHPDEFTALFNTILINVTGFFRDPEAWDFLRQECVADLVGRRPDMPVRVWSAGCASGEEAYTLAITLAEAIGVERFRERVKIYATDVDDEGLLQARQAAYSERAINGLAPELIERYFEKINNRYVFRKDLRRSVIFGRNDLVQDAPISRIDLLASAKWKRLRIRAWVSALKYISVLRQIRMSRREIGASWIRLLRPKMTVRRRSLRNAQR